MCQRSDAQTLSEAERYAAMDKNRVFQVNVDEYYVSEALADEGVAKGYVKEVPVAIYKILKEGYYTYCYGILFGQEIKLSLSSYFSFASDDDYQYLMKRGAYGAEIRKTNAIQLDAVQSAAFKKEVARSVEQDRKKSQEILNYLRKNRAIISSTYVWESYSDYRIELKICNWFSKKIKYLDLTVMAINNVGDPRWYDKDRCVKNIQCIGYINSFENVTYKFEDVFYDSSEAISDIIICGAVITFEDNSKITVNTQDAAAKMYRKNHDIELPNNFYQYIR